MNIPTTYKETRREASFRKARESRDFYDFHFEGFKREVEGLEVSKPWVISVGGHSDYIAPPGPTVEEIMKDLDCSFKLRFIYGR